MFAWRRIVLLLTEFNLIDLKILVLSDERYGEYLADVWQGYLISPLADDPRRADPFRAWLADQRRRFSAYSRGSSPPLRIGNSSNSTRFSRTAGKS